MADPVAAARSSLSGPASIIVQRTSWRGPLARTGVQRPIAPFRFTVINIGQAPLSLGEASLDPLSGVGGLVAPALLAIQALASAAIPARGSATVTITGTIPATPGRYETNARIAGSDGTSLIVPVTVNVSAHPLWSLACMLLGLAFLAIVTVLAGEGNVKTRLHDALYQRADIHAFLDRHPAPLARAADISAMDQDFELGLAELASGVPLSVVDHRTQDAADHLGKAGAIETSLRSQLSGQPRGKIALELLDRDLEALRGTFKQIDDALGPVPATTPDRLAGRIDAFLLRYRARFLTAPMEWTKAEAATDRNRASLALAAGEGAAAQAMAEATGRWLRRSSGTVNQSLVGYRTALATGGSLLVADSAIRARLARGDLPAAGRAQVLAHLDQAGALLAGDAWLPQWRDANHQINLAKTELTRVRANDTLARFRAAVADADAATDYRDVGQLVATLQARPDHSVLAAKRAGLAQVIGLWRAHVAKVTDPARRAALTHRLDSMAAIVAGGDLKTVGPAYRALLDDWNAWDAEIVTRAQDRITHVACVEFAQEIERDISAIEASLRERPPSSETLGWESRLDVLRLDLQRQGPDEEMISRACIKPLLDISGRANALSADVFTAGLIDAPIGAVTRVRLARESGVQAAITTAERAQKPRVPLALRR